VIPILEDRKSPRHFISNQTIRLHDLAKAGVWPDLQDHTEYSVNPSQGCGGPVDSVQLLHSDKSLL